MSVYIVCQLTLCICCCIVITVHGMLKSLSGSISRQYTSLMNAIDSDSRESVMSASSVKYVQTLQHTLNEVCCVVFYF